MPLPTAHLPWKKLKKVTHWRVRAGLSTTSLSHSNDVLPEKIPANLSNIMEGTNNGIIEQNSKSARYPIDICN